MSTEKTSSEKQVLCSLEHLKFDDFGMEEIDKSKYRRIKLEKITKEDIGAPVRTFGWVSTCRAQKKVSFVDLRSAFGTLKCVIPTSANINAHTSMTVYGQLVENRGKDSEDFELQVVGFEIYNGKQAPTFPLNKDSEKDTLLSQAHLGLRMKTRSFFLESRSHMLRLCREFYWSEDYCEITPPTLVQTQVEGGATLFKLDYYGEEAFLTQSSQLYLETAAPVAGKAFCIMPSYRAEKSRTNRHLSEFTHVEAELADIDFEQLMDQIEALIRYVTKRFYAKYSETLKELDADFTPILLDEKKFLRLEYSDAIDFLAKKGHLKTDGTVYEQGDDIADASEKFLIAEYAKGQPLFLTRFPVDHKPFYVRKDERGSQACDLLFPGVGEIVGGSMRADVYEDLIAGFEREGINPDAYYWYLDMAKFGPCCHGGYGLGFERLFQCLCRYKSVDQATLYARKPSRCTP